MNATRLTARPALRWLLALLAGGLIAASWSSPAHAVDNTLVASTPAGESTVETSPTVLTLQFASQLGTNNTVTMSCGPQGEDASPVTLGSPVLLADQVTLSVSVPNAVNKGVCNVVWQVTDTSLQPAGSGSFSFAVANDPVVTTPPTTTTTVPGTADTGVTTTTAATTTVAADSGDSTTTDDSDQATGPLGLFRWFSDLGVAVLLGSLIIIAVAWPEGVEYILTVRFLRWAWVWALAWTYFFAGATAADLSGESLGSTLIPTGWGDLLDTTPGKAALLRVVFVAAAVYVVIRPERSIDPATQLPALVPPALAVVTIAFGREEYGLIEWAAGSVHALSMAAWVGGLVLVWRVVLAGPGEEDLVHAVRGFSRLSTPAMWIAVLSGAALWFRLDRDDPGSNHGLVVLGKVVAVAAMLFVALAARQFIAQRVTRASSMTAPLAVRLRHALFIEMVIGVVVLGLSAWLLAFTPPGLEASGESSLDLEAPHEFVNESLDADVDVAFSEVVGPNDVRIEVDSPATGLSGLAVDFIPPPGAAATGMSIEPIPLTGAGVAVLEKEDGFTLNAAGTWTVIVRIGANEVDRTDVLVGGDG